MMLRIRRLIAYAAAAGLLTAGAVSVSMEVAHAASLCTGNSGDGYTCPLTNTVIWPVALSVGVTDTASTPTSENVTVSWGTSGISCTDSTYGTQTASAGADSGATPFTGTLPLLAFHPASAGHGLNLQHGGSRMAWLSPSWSAELTEQAIARIYRPGQTRHVTIHVCVAAGTVDEMKRDRVIGKMSAQDAFRRHLERV